VLPGVLLAVILSLVWLLSMALHPSSAVLGRVPGVAGFHNVADFPGAETTPGLLLYRFEGNLVFFNADAFCAQLEATIAAQATPVKWVVLDLAPVSLIDATALMRFDELRESLAARGVTLGAARVRRNLTRSFDTSWARARVASHPTLRFETIDEAIDAFGARSDSAEAASSAAAGKEEPR
jgi:MFS superfamily sulfate permease-like transporter